MCRIINFLQVGTYLLQILIVVEQYYHFGIYKLHTVITVASANVTQLLLWSYYFGFKA